MRPLLLPLPTHSGGWRWGVLADQVLFYVQYLCPHQCESWERGLGLRFRKDDKIHSFFNPFATQFLFYPSPIKYSFEKVHYLPSMRPWTGGCEGVYFTTTTYVTQHTKFNLQVVREDTSVLIKLIILLRVSYFNLNQSIAPDSAYFLIYFIIS
jgi:hypothetical protein